jgi:sarcosine oxidase subunit beta
MPLGLLKYGLSSEYPVEVDLPPPKELKSHYDVVIIGAGGHGLAIAYYLAKYQGITNVAVLEKSYLGGGNTARNTAVIRSNYLTSEGVKFYSESVDLFKNLSNEFDFNIMYSERGQLTLAHTDSTVRAFRQRAEVNKHFGGRTEMIDRQQIKELVPCLNLDPAHLPVLAGLWHMDGATARHDAVAWGYAKEAAKRGVEIHQLTEVQDFVTEKTRSRR